ncbi:DUF202 domain-containing protein [Streptomyces sp. NBC_01317]|uniref:DUF202 domain-containing protein n=1 Tax=Streptomyces sp. NBC_01317 TaxID=2903822 RepID=UPI002E0D12C8|nr:DUF202 domain-containing protein [Streptomyces sp. NBC_01317]
MSAGDQDRARDPGLQPERTGLAWRRTTLACTVVAVLAARQAVHHGGTTTGVVGISLTVVVWLGFVALTHRRLIALTTAEPRPLSRAVAVAAAACTLLLAGLAVAVMA